MTDNFKGYNNPITVAEYFSRYPYVKAKGDNMTDIDKAFEEWKKEIGATLIDDAFIALAFKAGAEWQKKNDIGWVKIHDDSARVTRMEIDVEALIDNIQND